MPLTDQEEYELLKLEKEKSFASTPGGAATGVIRPNRFNIPPEFTALSSIVGSGGMGAAAGAAAPEILTGAAGLMRQIPQGARFAPWLESAALAARSAGRPAGAAMGAVSGLGAETAGQAVDAMDAPAPVGEAVRFVAGGIAPEGLTLARKALEIYKKTPSLGFFAKGKKEIIKQIAAKLEGRPQDISEEEANVLNGLVGDLRGGAASDASQKGVYDVLQTGAQRKLAVGDTEASTIFSNSEQAIKRETEKTLQGPVAYAQTAADRIAKRGEDALATAQLQLNRVGNNTDMTDLGSSLRGTIVKRNASAIEARRAEDQALRTERDAVVSQKEAAGQSINSLPEYQDMVSSLQSQLIAGKRSPDVASTFQNILKSVTNPEKDVFGQSKPVSFQALDDVRRNLGQVFRGKPPEGYAGIDADTARKYYRQIGDIQERFAGKAQSDLQHTYADASEGLNAFKTRSGKKATALDGYIDDAYQTDASALPKDYFSSKTKIGNLIELTGNRGQVVSAGRDLAATELQDLTERQVREWMTKRREMLGTLPEVRDEVLKYANSLARGEAISRSAEGAIKRLQGYGSRQVSDLQSTTAAIQADAKTRATAAVTNAQQDASTLIGSRGEMFGAQRVKDLILSGNTKEWSTAAPLILQAQGGEAMFADAVRQTLAEKATQSTKGLSTFFDNNVVPALTATKIMKPAEINAISGQLSAIENMNVPDRVKIGLQRRVVLQAFGGYASSVGARTATNTGSGLVNLIPQ